MVIKVLSGKEPFEGRSDVKVVMSYMSQIGPVISKQNFRLTRPTQEFTPYSDPNEKYIHVQPGYCSDGRRLDDAWATLLERCLTWDRAKRIDMLEVVKEITKMRSDLL